MDFVASRADEKKLGWRNRWRFLQRRPIVFDPWFKPAVRGAHEYGLEDINTIGVRDDWTFEPGQAGDERRAACAEKFWETLHIDLRMVDTSDFTIAYCRLIFTALDCSRYRAFAPPVEAGAIR